MRITTSVIMFWLWFTSAAAVLEEAGVTAALGVETSVSTGGKLRKATEGLRSIQSGGVSTESVVGLYQVSTGAIDAFITGLTAGPRILNAIGMPMIFVAFLHAPVALLGGRMLIYAIAQRDL